MKITNLKNKVVARKVDVNEITISDYKQLFLKRIDGLVATLSKNYEVYNSKDNTNKMEPLELVFDRCLLKTQSEQFYEDLRDLYDKARCTGLFVTIEYRCHSYLPKEMVGALLYDKYKCKDYIKDK